MSRPNSLPLRILTVTCLLLGTLAITAPAVTATAAPAEAWQWPVHPEPDVMFAFDPPPEPWASGHRGVDLKVAQGTRILSPADGRVVFVGTVVDRPVITVDHGNGILSSFEPASATVEEGDTVRAGDELGTAASGGHCASACIHWGIRVHGTYVDPLDFIVDNRPSVLLPVPR